MNLTQIRGLLELGMFSESLVALKQLPEDLRESAVALRIAGRASAAMGDWEGAKAAADTLRHGNDLDRVEAACCYQSLAAEHFKHGRTDAARSLLQRAIATRPEHRALILDDFRFTEAFLRQFDSRASKEV